MKKKKIGIVGPDKPSWLEAIAMTDFGVAMAMQEQVQLKECHKTPEQKKLEVIQQLRKGLTDEMIGEYILIKRKQSKLSRTKREYIVSKIDGLIRKGLLTKEELNLLIEPIKTI